MITRRVLMAVAVTLASAVLAAQTEQKGQPAARPNFGQSAKEPASQKADKKPKTLHIKAARAEHDEPTNTDDLSNVTITDVDEGTVFRADQMKIDNMKSVKTADATGNLFVNDRQADLTGDNLKVYFARSKRLAVLTGNVVIQIKPKSEQKDPTAATTGPMPVSLQGGKAQVEETKSGDDEGPGATRKHPATITCDKLEYEYAKDKKRAVLTGNFKVVQKLPDHTRTLWAEHAEYFALEDKVILHAPVRWEDTKNNQKGSSPEDVVVFTKEGDERLSAKTVEITTEVNEDEEEEPAKPSGKNGEKPPTSNPTTSNPADKSKEKNPPPAPGPDKKSS